MYKQAFDINQSVIEKNISDKINGKALNENAAVLISLLQYETALDYLNKSLLIQQRLGDGQGESATMNNISQIYYKKGDVVKAMEYFKKDLQICIELRNFAGLAITMNNMGSIFFDLENYEDAIPLLLKAYSILVKMNSPVANNTAEYLGAIFERIGEEKANEILSNIK